MADGGAPVSLRERLARTLRRAAAPDHPAARAAETVDHERLVALARSQAVDPEVADCWQPILDALEKRWLGLRNLPSCIREVDDVGAGKGDGMGVEEFHIAKSYDQPGHVEVQLVDAAEKCPASKLAVELKRLMRAYWGLSPAVPPKPSLSSVQDPSGAIGLLAQLFDLTPAAVVGDLAAYERRWIELSRRERQIARAIRDRDPRQLAAARTEAMSLRDELEMHGIPGLDALPIPRPELKTLLRSFEEQSARSAVYTLGLLLNAVDDSSIDIRWLLDGLESSPIAPASEA